MRVFKCCAVALAAVSLGGVAAGCGSSSSTPKSTSAAAGTGVDKAAAAAVPAAIKAKGTLTVATDATYPPLEFVGPDGKSIEGIDPDLIRALGAAMGLKVQLVQAKFDGILPGLTAGKYDMAMSGFADTKEREQVVDVVDYMSVGEGFFVSSSVDPTSIKTLDDLCGKRVAVQQGTSNATEAHAADKKCGGNVTVLEYPDQNAAALAVASGRADVSSAAGPVAAYLVDQSGGKMKLAGQNYNVRTPQGMLVPKSEGLSQPLLIALKALVADGTYKKIIDHWHSGASAIAEPVINGATS